MSQSQAAAEATSFKPFINNHENNFNEKNAIQRHPDGSNKQHEDNRTGCKKGTSECWYKNCTQKDQTMTKISTTTFAATEFVFLTLKGRQATPFMNSPSTLQSTRHVFHTSVSFFLLVQTANSNGLRAVPQTNGGDWQSVNSPYPIAEYCPCQSLHRAKSLPSLLLLGLLK